MKKIFLLALIAILSRRADAQTFAEWFRQKATQKKYLIQQIAALQVYIGYVQKGYSIAQEGLSFISDMKNGELNLHGDYFSSFKAVNPNIRKYTKVADIIAFQLKINDVYKNASRQLHQSRAFNAGELNYISKVFNRLIDDCINTVDGLIVITTNNKLELTDDARLKRIDELYNDMQSKYSFAQNFTREAKLLSVSRLREQNHIQTSRDLNGIKN